MSATIQKPQTREFYESMTEKHLIPTLGALPLAKLTPDRVQELYRLKLESGLSSTTVSGIHRTLHRALVSAVKWGKVARNVCDAVDPPKKRHVEMATWTPAECIRFLAVAQPS